MLNSPAMAPDQLIAAFSDLANQSLAPWEFHYGSRYVASKWWSSSRLAAILYEVLKQDDIHAGFYASDSEGGMLGQAIISAFGEDVMAQDTVFIALHLPLRSHLLRHFQGVDPPYKFLLDYARNTFHYIAMQEHLDLIHVDDE